MITIFGTPRPFRGHFGVIQRNAITSWTQLSPRPQILIMGNDLGTAEVCRELSVTHVPGIACNEFGTPLMDSMVEQAESLAENDLLLLVTTDTLLFNDTMRAAQITTKRLNRFCIIVGRQHIQQTELINFSNSGWVEDILLRSTPTIPQDIYAGDYFLFSKGLWGDFPPFAIGRTICDNWMFYHVLASNGALVDATGFLTTIHQDHDYSHHPDGKQGVWTGVEAQRNKALVNPLIYQFVRNHSNWVLTSKGLRRQPVSFAYYDRWLVSQQVLHPNRWPMAKLCLRILRRISCGISKQPGNNIL